MGKNRHNKVVEILYQLSEDYEQYAEVYADHVSGKYKCINILSHTKRGIATVIPYYPDVWCKYRKSNKIDVFEVWDNQSEDACVEDILFATLTLNIETLYIICFDKRQYELATRLVKVILSSLFDEDGKLLLDPSMVLRM